MKGVKLYVLIALAILLTLILLTWFSMAAQGSYNKYNCNAGWQWNSQTNNYQEC